MTKKTFERALDKLHDDVKLALQGLHHSLLSKKDNTYNVKVRYLSMPAHKVVQEVGHCTCFVYKFLTH